MVVVKIVKIEIKDEDDIPLSVLHERLQLDSMLTLADDLNIDNDLATEQVDTEETIFASLRNGNTKDADDNELDDEESAVPIQNQHLNFKPVSPDIFLVFE